MKPAPFAYRRPGTLAEAVAALAGDRGPRCWRAARAWSRCCRCGWPRPSMLVDINGLPGLDTIKADDGGVADRGAGPARRRARLADVRRVQPLVTLALSHVAHATIRNRGTTVGSLVHADAAAEMPVVLVLLGGSVEVEGPGGTAHHPRRRALRRTAGVERCTTTRSRCRRSSRRSAPGAGVAFEEIARRHGDYALVGVAALVDGDSVKVGYLSVGDVPTVVDLSGVPDDRLGDGGAGAARPGRRHPRHRRLPRPAGARADRPRGSIGAGGPAERMSEELHDVRAAVNGTAHPRAGARAAAAVRRAAPRPRADRHPRRLRARRLRRLHGPGRRPADALLPDVRGLRRRRRDHHRRGADRRRRLARARCSRRSWSATGCSAASALRASSPRSPPGCATTPTPTHEEARDMIAGNLCRCTGYQNIVKAVERAAETPGRGTARDPDDRSSEAGSWSTRTATSTAPPPDSASMTTKLMGQKVQRVEDQRFLRGKGRYVDDVAVGTGRLHAAVLRSPHAHARIVDIDVSEVLDLEGVHAVCTYDDLDRPDGRAAAAADPAPGADPRPHPVRTGQGRGQLRRRGGGLRGGRRPLRRRGRRRPDRVDYEVLPPVVGIAAARAAERLVHDDVPGNVGARMEQNVGDAEGRDRGGAAPARPRPDHRAQRLHADGGSRHGRPLGPRPQPAPGLDLDPDLDRRPGRGRGQAGPRPRPGRRDHARRRRRLRREDQPPVARGAAGPAGRAGARPDREVHRGPARALHLLRPRARPGPAHRGRLRRRRPAARAGRGVLARPRRLHAVRPDRPDHHLDPAARPLQAARTTGSSSSRSTPTP